MYGDDRDRTGDPLLAKQVLSQLSYAPGNSRQFSVVSSRTEPPEQHLEQTADAR